MQLRSSTGSPPCATSVPSKSVLRRRILEDIEIGNLGFDFATAIRNGQDRSKGKDEIGLRTGNGTAREKCAERRADRGAKAADRGDRFNVQGADRREGIVSQRSDQQDAARGKH